MKYKNINELPKPPNTNDDQETVPYGAINWLSVALFTSAVAIETGNLNYLIPAGLSGIVALGYYSSGE